jgi:hypothetical protein
MVAEGVGLDDGAVGVGLCEGRLDAGPQPAAKVIASAISKSRRMP